MPFSTRYKAEIEATVHLILDKAPIATNITDVEQSIQALTSFINQDEKSTISDSYINTINELNALIKKNADTYVNDTVISQKARNPLTGKSEKEFEPSIASMTKNETLAEAKQEFVKIVNDVIKSQLNKLQERLKNKRNASSLMRSMGLHNNSKLEFKIPSPIFPTATPSKSEDAGLYAPIVSRELFNRNLNANYDVSSADAHIRDEEKVKKINPKQTS